MKWNSMPGMASSGIMPVNEQRVGEGVWHGPGCSEY